LYDSSILDSLTKPEPEWSSSNAKTRPQILCNRASSLLSFSLFITVVASDFKREVVYQIITDRFFDGSTANNNRRKALDCMTRPKQTGGYTGAAICRAFSKSCPTSPAWASLRFGFRRRSII